MGKLTQCADCGGTVSTSAKACPHCGAKVKAETTSFTKAVGLLAGVMILYAIVVSSGTKTGPSPSDQMADNATRLCFAIKKAGASACEVDFNVTEPSYIEATINTTMGTAGDFCNAMARTARDGGVKLATATRPWELRIYTPASVRPVAACTLS